MRARRILRILLASMTAAVIVVELGIGSALLYLLLLHERFDGVVVGGASFRTSGDLPIGLIDTCRSDSKYRSCAIQLNARGQIPAANTLPVGSKRGHGPPGRSAIGVTHGPHCRRGLQISGCGSPSHISS